MAAGPSKSAWLRVPLSLAILFHLMAVILAPNSENYLGAKVAPLIGPYIHFFGLFNAWRFFAPDPAPPIYVDYELYDSKGTYLARGSWPEWPDPYFFRERQTRRVSATSFMFLDDMKIEKMLLPYICQNHPEAAAVSLWKTAHKVPSVQDILDGKRHPGDQIGVDRKFVSRSFCEREKG